MLRKAQMQELERAKPSESYEVSRRGTYRWFISAIYIYIEVPPNVWFIVENHIKMDDLYIYIYMNMLVS